jgi:hypothetical protein
MISGRLSNVEITALSSVILFGSESAFVTKHEILCLLVHGNVQFELGRTCGVLPNRGVAVGSACFIFLFLFW